MYIVRALHTNYGNSNFSSAKTKQKKKTKPVRFVIVLTRKSSIITNIVRPSLNDDLNPIHQSSPSLTDRRDADADGK